MHLEPTSRCTLACTACPRTWFSDQFDRPFPKQDLDVDDLWKFLDCDAGKNVGNFLLNGNHGDPIYYPKLFELIDRFRDSKTYKISTNGSHQHSKFWHNLSDRLTPQDTVYFSIDGLEHNNHLYRKNSNWESIMNGLDIMLSSSARVVWKTLIFSYNEHEISQIEKFATDKGCIFVVEPTARFGSANLVPTEQNIDDRRLYSKDKNVVLDPQCMTQQYISADGYFWPCCLITSFFTLHKTDLWKHKQEWSIKTQTLDQAQKRLRLWYDSILEDQENAHDVCKMNCKPGQKFVWVNS